jgi:hypothetical protein
LIILSILILTDARATSLRCGVRLIMEGDFKVRVLTECGEPDYVEVWEEERVYGFRNHPSYNCIYEDYEYRRPDLRYGKSYRTKKTGDHRRMDLQSWPRPVHGSPQTGKRHCEKHQERRLWVLRLLARLNDFQI